MVKPFLHYSCCVAMMAATLATAARAQTAAEDDAEPAELPAVVARIGDEVITGEEFQQDLTFRQAMLEAETGQHVEDSIEFRRATLEELVNGRVAQILARNSGLRVTEEEVDAEVALSKVRSGSEERYREFLKQYGLTEEKLREQLRLKILKQKWAANVCEDMEGIAEEELERLYQRGKALGKFTRHRTTSDVAQIFIPVNPARTGVEAEPAQKQVEAARARVLAGEDFREVAREISQDKLRPPGEIYPESSFSRVVPKTAPMMRELELGAVSEPFRSQLGWHIITVLQRHEPGIRPFEEVRPEMEGPLVAQLKIRRIMERVEEAKLVIHIEITPLDEPGAKKD